MPQVRITIEECRCRSGCHHQGDTYVVGDVCPPICHELWQVIYPSVYVLLNNGDLDFGTERARAFSVKCPDEGRVVARGTVEGA